MFIKKLQFNAKKENSTALKMTILVKNDFGRKFFWSKGAPPMGPRFFKKRSDHMGNLLEI